MARLPLYQVDAFTNRRFGGNPAAVVLLDAWLPDDVMRAIAAENNLAETAFVIPSAPHCRLRWFTPEVEVDLCGHATLATAHVLFSRGLVRGTRVTFDTKSGLLPVEREDGRYVLDFPSRPGRPIAVDDTLTEALGARPSAAFLSRDLMAVFESEETVQSLAPDMARVALIDAFAVIATAPGRRCDFVSRFFAPRAGIPEDPVTGSAHCTLTPYWSDRLGRTTLHARQISRRSGDLHCTLAGDRVRIAGEAVDYLDGHIAV